jgi:hypothetical protein
MMRYAFSATARPFGVLPSLALPVESSHRQGLPFSWTISCQGLDTY